MSALRGRLAAWAAAPGPFGVRPLNAGFVMVVIAIIEVNVEVGKGPGAVPLTFSAYLAGALIAVPVLFRHRWPFQVLIACAIGMFFYYIFARRNISPAPLLSLPLYDSAVAGYLAWAIAIPTFFMTVGWFFVQVDTHDTVAAVAVTFLPQVVVLALAVMLGEVVRGRRAVAAETASRLAAAQEERAAEAGRVVAEERLRIARELHDTVAHSMATITVQAASAMQLLGRGGVEVTGKDSDRLGASLTAIRDTSKGALAEMREVLGELRRTAPRADGTALCADGTARHADGTARHADGTAPCADGTAPRADGTAPADRDAARTGLGRLPALRAAVTAAGAPVTVTVAGDEAPLPPQTDHCAYRILQESLTNVLRHQPPGTPAHILMRYLPGALTLTVSSPGPAVRPAEAGTGLDAGHRRRPGRPTSPHQWPTSLPGRPTGRPGRLAMASTACASVPPRSAAR